MSSLQLEPDRDTRLDIAAGPVTGHDKFHEWCGAISVLAEEIDPVGKPAAALQIPIHHVDCVTGETREK